MTAKEYQQMLREQAKKKPSKHHNKFVYVYEDGFIATEKELPGHGKVIEKYDSVKEFHRYRELQLMERAGAISDLHRQVPMLIQDKFKDSSGKWHKAIVYKADFTYKEKGKEVVEDVKGIDRKTGRPQTTESFRMKWKLLLAKYPEKEFRIY